MLHSFWHNLASFPSKLAIDIKQAIREAKQSKIQYLIGTASVFLVVTLVALLSTALGYSSVVFLSLAEAESGELDLVVSAQTYSGFNRINYTHASQLNSVRDQIHLPRYSAIQVAAFKAADCTGFDANSPKQTQILYQGNQQCPLGTGALDCLKRICSMEEGYKPANLFILQSERERKMGIGRGWPYGPVPANTIYIHSSVARALNAYENDWLYLSFDLRELFPFNFEYAANFTALAGVDTVVNLPLQVSQVFSNPYGKYSAEVEDVIMLEWDTALETIATVLSSVYSDSFKQRLSSPQSKELMDQSVTQIVFSCAEDRIECYMDSNYRVVAKRLIDWSSALVYDMGFPSLASTLDVLANLDAFQYFSAFIDLLFTIVTIMLCALSVFLIYSLLLVAVETKTFELGVFRMIGMTKWGVIMLILVQALSYAIPGWILGLTGAQVAWIFLEQSLERLIKVKISIMISTRAIILSTILGIFVPLVAAILPIRSALTGNLHDSLDKRRSKSKGVVVSIERSSANSVPLGLLYPGILLTAFGFLVYYFLPLALVYRNVTLLFNIFLGLLVGMLLGLVMLSLNLLPLMERLVTGFIFIVLFWEKRSMPRLVLKNLIAHRIRNRKTSITFSIALGFILFVTTAIRTELNSLIFSRAQSYGAPLVIFADVDKRNTRGQLRGIENRYEFEDYCTNNPWIDSFAYVSTQLSRSIPSVDRTDIMNIGRIVTYSSSFYGVSPNAFDLADSSAFTRVHLMDPDLAANFDIDEQMYTAKGSYSVLLGTLFQTKLNLGSLMDIFLAQITYKLADGSLTAYTKYQLTPLAFMDSAPVLKFSPFPSIPNQDAGMAFTTLFPLTNGTIRSMRDLAFSKMLIHFKANTPPKEQLAIVQELSKIKTSESVRLLSDQTLGLQSASNTLSWIFQIVTVIVMSIAFFSLNSSMFTNMMEQVKEIGILRAIGLGRFNIFRLFVYEAFVVVFASALMGILIGTVIGWSMALQRAVLIGVPLTFIFPWDILVVILGVSFASAFFSTTGPFLHIVFRQSIISNIRS